MTLLNIEFKKKRTIFFVLKSIFGYSNWQVTKICNKLSIGKNLILTQFDNDVIIELTQYIENNDLQVGDNLKEQTRRSITLLKTINCYKGLRHKINLPVRGQRTRTNASKKYKN